MTDYSIYIFHILFVGPLLTYIGLYHTTAPLMIWKLLVIMGLGIIFYHSWMMYTRYKLVNTKLKIPQGI